VMQNFRCGKCKKKGRIRKECPKLHPDGKWHCFSPNIHHLFLYWGGEKVPSCVARGNGL
jgi:hypothetical protein